MVRAVLLVAVLVGGCSSSHAKTPAWPKMAAREVDGGESLAPRAGAKTIAAAADDDDDDDIKVVPTPVAATPAAAATTATPAATPTVTAPEETITIDDIVIEIDD